MKRLVCVLAVCAAVLVQIPAAGQPKPRHNKLIDLLARNQVVFGWFSPGRTADQAKRAAGDPLMDFVFINMEAVQSYRPDDIRAFTQAMVEGGLKKNPNSLALMTRLPIFHDDPAAARQRTAEMLNLGVQAIVFPDMESADEAQQAIGSMRYAQSRSSKSPEPAGTRPEGAGDAPAFWGLSEAEYKQKADVYPLNPSGSSRRSSSSKA